jgi:predicted Zn-dependent protease
MLSERMGETAVARSGWEAFLAREPAQPDALLHYALLLWHGGERERADAAIVGAIRSQPTPNAQLESALSQYYGITQRHAEALTAARRASELAPGDPVVGTRYALALARGGQAATARETALRLTQQFPSQALAWSTLASIAATVGDVQTAERAFRTWLELSPADSNAHANYGLFLHRTGRTPQARTLLEKASRDFPGHGAVWMNYAVVLTALGEVQAAAEARTRAEALLTDEQRALLLR